MSRHLALRHKNGEVTTLQKNRDSVNMTKIYTRKGDQGQTRLVEGAVVEKDHPRIKAFGTVDELNSAIGYLVALCDQEKGFNDGVDWIAIKGQLTLIQNQLFCMGSHLAAEEPQKMPRFKVGLVAEIESWIDGMDKKLSPLKSFILPGGSLGGAFAHWVRATCRRAEREICELNSKFPIEPEIIVVANRLSDYFFTLARFLNWGSNQPQKEWAKD